MFPLRIAFDPKAINEWQRDYVESNPSRWGIWGPFQAQVLKNISDYRLPVIRLAKETPKEAVCTVFEKVNTGGVSLNVFELLTATYAGDTSTTTPTAMTSSCLRTGSRCRTNWRRIPCSRVEDSDFLQAVCLVSTHHRRRGRPGCGPVHAARGKLQAQRHPGPSAAGVHRLVSADRVRTALDRWVSSPAKASTARRDLPYRGQITSLAAIRTVLGGETDSPQAEAKITRWYWCGVLGEQYGGSPDSRLPRDLEQVVGWVRGGPPPASVLEASFPSGRLNTMSSRNSAAYKGVLALLLRQGAIDWTYSKEPINPTIFEDQQVDVALIFPKAVVRKARRQPGAQGQHRQQDAADPPHPSDHGKSDTERLPEATGDRGRVAVQLAGRHPGDAPGRRAVSARRRFPGRGGERSGLRRVLRGTFGRAARRSSTTRWASALLTDSRGSSR